MNTFAISYETRSIAMTALYHHQRTLQTWIEMEVEVRLRDHLHAELDRTNAAIRELGGTV